jgi:HK97 gp10 family phage protein
MARAAVGKVALRKQGAFTVDGYNESIDKVNRILDGMQSDNLKGTFLKGAMLIRDKAKQNAPYGKDRKSGFHLKDAIFAAPGATDKSDALVGVSRSRRKTGHPAAPHGLLVHEGTKERQTKKGANRGKVNANPFFKRALAETKDQVGQIIITGLKNVMETAAK